MGRFSENLGKAADNAERLASALESIPAAGSDSVGGGGGGATPGAPGAAGGFRAPTQVIFNTTLEGTGGSGGSGEISRGNNGGLSEEIIRAFAYYGLKPGGQSAQRIEEILRLFRALRSGKNFEMMMRTEGMS